MVLTKPELLATAADLEELYQVIDAGADAVAIGHQQFGMRLAGDFNLQQLAEAARYVHSKQRKLYVVVNVIVNNELIPQLPAYLIELEQLGADAIIFGDPAVILALRESGVTIPLHWNPEMIATNYASANYWARKGAVRAILARELNMEQIVEFKKHAKLDIQVQVHGMTNIFHSKRSMVSNYQVHIGKKTEDNATNVDHNGVNQGLFLLEAERRDERYPIYEDGNGTHIMSADDICMIENLHELLEVGVNSLKIEGLMKTTAYQAEVVRVYREAIDCYMADPLNYEWNPEWLERIEAVQPAERPLSYGFFYKEQVY